MNKNVRRSFCLVEFSLLDNFNRQLAITTELFIEDARLCYCQSLNVVQSNNFSLVSTPFGVWTCKACRETL